MKFKSKIPIILIIFLVFIIGAFSTWVFNKNKYEYVSPKRGNIIEAIYGLGKVKSYRKYDIKLGIITNVKKVFVKLGQFVNKGDPLIKFNNTGTFRAPFSGTVTNLPFNAPDTVLPQVSTLTLQNLSEKYLEVSLEQDGALRVSNGQSAKVSFESLRGEIYQGKVTSIFPKDDEFLAHINVEGLGSNVLPGMTADISIIVGEHKDALLVPVSSLSNGRIIIKRDGKKQKIPIKIGSIDGNWAEVIGGDINLTDEVLLKKSNSKSDKSNVLLGN